MRGVPIVVVTMVGAKSGKLRKNPVMRVEHGGEYAVVASKGGADQHPTWYHNMVKNPNVELQDGAVRRDYVAHLAAGGERDIWWDRAVAVWPDYAEYQKKTERVIPVFVLVPVEDVPTEG
ncbi:nitroreductase family deazaflavin-dependent oxidoreductase [Humibacter ginsenosidimutans]|uniref:nitroreductase family deazaflavin-dependent oxidoreductase n=1 Tax=Humibacter ginsenosidimutans TaxID=2599293 RepID=UPI00349E7EFF